MMSFRGPGTLVKLAHHVLKSGIPRGSAEGDSEDETICRESMNVGFPSCIGHCSSIPFRRVIVA